MLILKMRIGRSPKKKRITLERKMKKLKKNSIFMLIFFGVCANMKIQEVRNGDLFFLKLRDFEIPHFGKNGLETERWY
jgi:hypothetical protein